MKTYTYDRVTLAIISKVVLEALERHDTLANYNQITVNLNKTNKNLWLKLVHVPKPHRKYVTHKSEQELAEGV